MSHVAAVLELVRLHTREGGAMLPSAVLDEVLRQTGAQGGALGWGKRQLASAGTVEGARRTTLTAGRDEFWLELSGGAEPEPLVKLAAGVVLSSWLMREELKQARFAERRRLWEVESLRAIAEALGGTLDPLRIAEELVLHAAALLDARRGEAWLVTGETLRARAAVSGAGAVVPCPDGGCTVAARVGGPILSDDEARTLADEGILEEGRLALPVTGRRGRLGILALAEREVRGGTAPFTTTDRETLALYAAQAAVALENAVLHSEALERERLERELELAATIQRQLLPDSFAAPYGFEIAARSDACRHVGGDVYDVVATPRGTVLMLADVAGKGVPAALMASSLHAAVHLLAAACPDIGELAQRLHRHLLAATPANKFATAFLACLGADGTLEYASAGHNPALLVFEDGNVATLEPVGPPMGLLPDCNYPSQRAWLPPGTLLVAYTDGLSEAPAAADDEDFGFHRIRDSVVTHRQEPLPVIIERLLADVDRHTGGAALHDDRSVLALRRTAM